MNAKDLSISKALSWLLRHGAITEGLKVNEEGFIQLEQVLQHRLFARRSTAADIRRVVTLSKNRFTLQANPRTGIYEIRANSGHTFKDSNNQEVKALVKLNRGRPIPQTGLKSSKSNHQQSKKAESLRNYNLPVGNILLPDDENHHAYPGGRPETDKLMKYSELKRALIWILRYGAEKEGLTVKRHGYVPIEQILNHNYFKNKCMREDILTVANNEPHNFKVRTGPHTQQIYIRARKQHPIKLEQEDWSVIASPVYLPLGFVVHGINGSDWDNVSQYGLQAPQSGYLYCSPYEPADCWHTPGVTKYDDIYIYINAHDAMQDGIEFFRTAEDSVVTKGDNEGFIGTHYFKKVVDAKTVLIYKKRFTTLYMDIKLIPTIVNGELINPDESCRKRKRERVENENIAVEQVTYYTPMEPTTNKEVLCEVCNLRLNEKNYQVHITGKKHISKQKEYDKIHKSIFVSGASKFTQADLQSIFRRFGEVSQVVKQNYQGFGFVYFTDKESVERAIKARVFAGGQRLFVSKYENKNGQSGHNEKSRKFSETLSNTSQSELLPGQFGVEELPVELPEVSQCPTGQDLFEWQVQQIISQVELSQEMYHRLNDVISDVEDLFHSSLPGSRVIVFGSCGSTLAFKNSDVDLFLQCQGQQPTDFVRREARALYRSRQLKILTRIPGARVPIVKFEHLKTGWQGDLTAHCNLGVFNSHLIRFLISLDPRIRPLVMVVKYWAKACGLSGSHQGMTTYTLVMLVIFYLQSLSPPMLPSVFTLQQLVDPAQRQINHCWDCSYCSDEWTLREAWPQDHNNTSLKQLLIGFFQFYDTYDYNNVICPLLGRPVPVKDFEDPEKLPVEMQRYRDNLDENKMRLKTNVMLRVQDPFELCHNIGKNVTDKTFFMFRKACTISYELGIKSDEGTLLKSLFTIDKEALDSGEECIKFHLPFKSATKGSAPSEDDISNWYNLSTEAILLVLRQILKLKIEPSRVENSNKVKKTDSSQDVHTSAKSDKSSEDAIYICNGTGAVWNSRKKTSKILNRLNVPYNSFEREVCISNILYKPNQSVLFTFNLIITSFEKFKRSPKGIDIVINDKKSGGSSDLKEMVHFLKFSLKIFILQAAAYIVKTKESSSVAEVKESLRELFDLKMDNLLESSDFKNLISEVSKQEELTTSKGKGKKEKPNQQMGKFSATSSAQQGSTSMESEPSAGPSQIASEQIHSVNKNFEINCNPPVNKVVASDESTDNVNVGKCNDMLKVIERCNTKSTESGESQLTGENTNPFLASIEKVSAGSTSHPVEESNVTDVEQKGECKVNEDCDSQLQETTSTNLNKEEDVEENIKNPVTHSTPRKMFSPIIPIHQRPKIYIERPQKFRKPLHYNYRCTRPNLQNENSSAPQSYANVCATISQQSRPNAVHGNGNSFIRSDKHQKQLATSVEKHKEWYPTLFKNK